MTVFDIGRDLWVPILKSGWKSAQFHHCYSISGKLCNELKFGAGLVKRYHFITGGTD